MNRRKVMIGDIPIGGGSPIAIQSMCSVDTADVETVIEQCGRLERAGCEIIRVAAYDRNSAAAVRSIKDTIHMPLVADVHFDYRIAICAMENGADKVRINPGNIGDENRIRSVVDAAKAHHIPIRVGANSGSLAEDYGKLPLADALVESALSNVRILEKLGFYDIVISLKGSSAAATVEAYRKMAAICDYPLHVGITEAGVYSSSVIKSSSGIGALVLDGLADTIRVSITGDPAEEISVAKDILRFCGVRSFGAEVISCPTCGRTRINLEKLATEVSMIAKKVDKPLKIAVMGCAVNGPGEAKDADIGIAGGNGEGLIFIKGKPYRKYKENVLLEEFEKLLREL